MVLGAVSVVVGTLQAIRQDDAKRLLAYSSVANGGYIIIGLASGTYIGVGGALMHIFAHAVATAAAFLAIVAVKYRTGTSKVSELGGIIHKMPVTYVVYLMAIISLCGIPPMAGFISKWLLYQTLMDQGLVFISVAAFFGSLGSFLYVFRPLAGLFLGQELPEYKEVKEAPIMMLIPMVILSAVTLFFGVLPNSALAFINEILASVGFETIKLGTYIIEGFNGALNPTLITIVFGLGVVIIFIIFMILPKSRKTHLMDNYTSSEFIYTESLMHYSADFYAPFERMYENMPEIVKLYEKLAYKITELGQLVSTLFFSFKPEATIFWVIVAIIISMWGANYGI
jgi:NADH-quinone oxidoreductase subunit M